MWNLKNNTNEFNKTEADSQIENEFVVTRGEREIGKEKTIIRDQEVQTTLYKINEKDILYRRGNRVNIL